MIRDPSFTGPTKISVDTIKQALTTLGFSNPGAVSGFSADTNRLTVSYGELGPTVSVPIVRALAPEASPSAEQAVTDMNRSIAEGLQRGYLSSDTTTD